MLFRDRTTRIHKMNICTYALLWSTDLCLKLKLNRQHDMTAYMHACKTGQACRFLVSCEAKLLGVFAGASTRRLTVRQAAGTPPAPLTHL